MKMTVSMEKEKNNFSGTLEKLFGLDLRSLALFRVELAKEVRSQKSEVISCFYKSNNYIIKMTVSMEKEKNNFSGTLEKMFGLDLRSLALFRAMLYPHLS
ncbi:MAG: hypothetical protein F6K54_09260 [Okeania sp. SIO3B5]|uniref:hypothetical protein n=1 Tax=Okeania sp. SIO3B5 TaxID=2607811 RepID=UPI0013FFCF50|nr:hypothetical protein [Okeania sp. SIO3B5]NEO53247.1 hypothetical protein [Okeania sp. SIO3B5]